MTYDKPITEIIKQRFSCRNYLEQPIDAEKRQQLADYAAAAQIGPFGTRSRFELIAATEGDRKALKGLGTYGFIKGATGFIIGATEERGKSLEDFGYLMEKIILFSTDIGLGTCWLGGTFTRSRFARKIAARGDEIIPAVTAVGHISKKPRRVDRKIRQTAGSDRRRPWEKMFFDAQFGVPLSRAAAGEYAVPLEMTRIGPSASNRQPWRVIKNGDNWRFYVQRTPGYRTTSYSKLLKIADLQRVDMGIALCHFELVARELGLEGRWETEKPAIDIPDERTEFIASWVS